ncbi:MAG: cysteine desulfurase [Lachnospiraceae bacterium]|nr:cysteine desulfurase [Lachnospiraceae bacterium]
MEAYLDNSATTRCSDEAVKIMTKVLQEDFGNPSSLHNKGMEGENYVKAARSEIAKTLKVNDKEIYFTSGGTESNNLAIIGVARAYRRSGNKVITTMIEHPSVANPFAYLEDNGFEVTYLPVDNLGRVDLNALRDAMTEDTILVSVMHVNNEIGAVQPIEEIAEIVKSVNKECVFHVDAIQSYGKFRIYPKKIGVDMLSVSGHKIHGPKGSGFLFVKDKIKLKPIILGGGQEWGMRSGTENVPAIAGLGVAAREIYADFDNNIDRMYKLRDRFISEVTKIDGVTVNGPLDHSGAPHIISVSVSGVRAEVLLHALEDRGIYVSAGSACSSNKPSISKTLKAIGLDQKLLDSTVRFSFSIHTTEEEVDYAVSALKELVPMLSKYTRH